MYLWSAVLLLGAIAARYLIPTLHASAVLPIPKYTPFNNTICLDLARYLPDVVFLSHAPDFHSSIGSYWSQNAREVDPHCIVRPSTVDQLSTALALLKSEFDSPKYKETTLRFAVKSGGHSPEKGVAGVDAGVIVDLVLFDNVAVSNDRQAATIGVGARWGSVATKLDSMGLAVIGGRNADVGVGGLVLGGGLSFFSPQYGFVCDNIEEYEVVLANGTIVYATSTQHTSLWRALKGGGGNFGIVTQIRTKVITSSKVWSGYLFSPSWEVTNALRAFVDSCKATSFDEFVSGPVVALIYVQQLGIRLTATGLTYMKPEKWPNAFRAFRRLWRVWSTVKVQPLSSASQELHNLAPSGKRQIQLTTTVEADLDTLIALNEVLVERIGEFKIVKGGVLSLIFQPLCPSVVGPDAPNVLGLRLDPASDCLVIVLLGTTWDDAADDELAYRVSQNMVASFDSIAEKRGTSHPFRYLNYAGTNQDPISSYGMASQKYLHDVSRLYDPQGFFQMAKKGGFKLGLYDGH